MFLTKSMTNAFGSLFPVFGAIVVNGSAMFFTPADQNATDTYKQYTLASPVQIFALTDVIFLLLCETFQSRSWVSTLFTLPFFVVSVLQAAKRHADQQRISTINF